MNFILEQFAFYFAIIMVLFLPGWFLMQAVFSRKKISKKHFPQKNTTLFNPIEKFVISFGLSIVSVDFLMILIGKLNIALTRWSLLLTIFLFSFICWIISNNFKFLKNRNFRIKSLLIYLRSWINKIPKLVSFRLGGQALRIRTSYFRDDTQKELHKPNKQTVLIILILFLTFFIKATYLQNTIFPTATDLGHHMYWSKQISETGELPIYQKIKIIKNRSNDYQLSEPLPISDFIIGEHLIFSAINLISKIPFISYFPTLVLFLVNIMGLLAIFIFSLRLFDKLNSKWRNSKTKLQTLTSERAEIISIFVLFLIGPLWALSSPHAKFVSGGVIGNLLGNFFIPLCLYFYFRAFTEKSTNFLITALFLTMGLFYTHHLSGLIFLFIIIFTILVFFILLLVNIFKSQILNYKFSKLFKILKSEIKNYKVSAIMVFLFIAITFAIFVYMPAYLTNHATGTAVGAPSKATRAGLTFSQFKYAIGEPRLALGIIGIFLLLFFKFSKKKSTFNFNKIPTIGVAILLGWTLALSLMTLKPQWLYLNLPSGRIANYANFPFAILAGLAMIWIVEYATTKHPSNNTSYYLPKITFISFAFLLFVFIFTSGFYDNSQSLTKKPNNQRALQTFQASSYLKNNLNFNKSNKIIILKDHNYLKSDSWIKLFFMQDYSIPFSRSYFKRYSDPTKPREMCTLWMISEPISERAQKCYTETDTKFILINPKFDSAQFNTSRNFWKIYTGDDITIYYRPQ